MYVALALFSVEKVMEKSSKLIPFYGLKGIA